MYLIWLCILGLILIILMNFPPNVPKYENPLGKCFFSMSVLVPRNGFIRSSESLRVCTFTNSPWRLKWMLHNMNWVHSACILPSSTLTARVLEQTIWLFKMNLQKIWKVKAKWKTSFYPFSGTLFLPSSMVIVMSFLG